MNQNPSRERVEGPRAPESKSTSKPSPKHRRGEEPVPSLLNHYRGHKGPILSLAFHPNLQTVFSSSADGYVMNWNYRRETRALRFEGHTCPVNDVNISVNGDLMISASDDCTVRVWVPMIAGHYVVVKGHNAAVRSACFNPVDPSIFATGSNDKTVKLWSIQTAKMKSGATKFKSHDFIQSFRNHNNWVRSVRFSPDGNLLCSASDDKTVRVFDLRSRECTATLTMPSSLGIPTKAQFNPCGNSYIGVSTTEKAFLMYDVRQKSLLQSYEALHQGSVNDFAFHPTGDFAVCVSEDSKIKILDLIEGRPIFTLHGPRKGLNAVAFNGSGSLFATGGKDDELLIWEPTLIPHECPPEEGDSATTKNSPSVPLSTKGSNKENLSSSSNSDIPNSKSQSVKTLMQEQKQMDKRTPSTSKQGLNLETLSRSSSASSNASASY